VPELRRHIEPRPLVQQRVDQIELFLQRSVLPRLLRLGGRAMIVPYFECPPFEDYEEQMQFDRDLAAEHPTFARNRTPVELSEARRVGVSSNSNITVVKELRPGCRIRRFTARTAEDVALFEVVVVPDDYFEGYGLPEQVR
jgi:hypothetical protein